MSSVAYAQTLGRISQSVVRTGDDINVDVDLPAGKDVTAWVKTSASVAACNLPGGHGYSNGNFDIFWDVAGVKYQRRNVPGTISTNALSLSGGAGTDFPASATTGVVVCKQVAFNIYVDGDNCKIVGVCGAVAAAVTTALHVSLYDVTPTEVTTLALVANVPNICDIEGGATNLYTGNVILSGVGSNGNSTYAAVLQLSVVYDATP